VKKSEEAWISLDIEEVYVRINSVSSEYELTRLVLMAYRLHKANKKGFLSSEIPESGISEGEKPPTMKAFMDEAEQRTGLSKSTLYEHIKKGQVLEKLDGTVLKACLGTSLANKLGDLVRIAAIPKAEIQLDLVNLYDRRRSDAKDELAKWEAHFSLPQSSTSKKKNPGSESAGQMSSSEDLSEHSNDLTAEAPEISVEEPRTMAVVSVAKTGQLEGSLLRTNDGFEGELALDGKTWRLVVARDCKTFVLVPRDGSAASPLRPLAKGEGGPLTGEKLLSVIRQIVGNVEQPKEQPNGVDVAFRFAGTRWVLSWWPAMPRSQKIELSHLSPTESIATIKGPWTVDEFYRSFHSKFRTLKVVKS
jgi:hypothetical protein